MSVSRVIAAPSAAVWATLSDIGNADRWNQAWTGIELTSNQHHGLGTRFRARAESGDTFEFEVCEWSAPRRIAFCPIRESAEMYQLMLDRHAFELHSAGNEATLIELTAHATARGLRGRFIGLFLWPGHQKEGLSAALDALAQLFEPASTGVEEEAAAGPAPE